MRAASTTRRGHGTATLPEQNTADSPPRRDDNDSRAASRASADRPELRRRAAARLDRALVHSLVHLCPLAWTGSDAERALDGLRACLIELRVAQAGLGHAPLATRDTLMSRPTSGRSMTAARLRSLQAVVIAAIDELGDLVDPDPAAGYANRAIRHTIGNLENCWLPGLARATGDSKPR